MNDFTAGFLSGILALVIFITVIFITVISTIKALRAKEKSEWQSLFTPSRLRDS